MTRCQKRQEGEKAAPMASPAAFLLLHRITAEAPADPTPPSQTTARVMVGEASGVVSFFVLCFSFSVPLLPFTVVCGSIRQAVGKTSCCWCDLTSPPPPPPSFAPFRPLCRCTVPPLLLSSPLSPPPCPLRTHMMRHPARPLSLSLLYLFTLFIMMHVYVYVCVCVLRLCTDMSAFQT